MEKTSNRATPYSFIEAWIMQTRRAQGLLTRLPDVFFATLSPLSRKLQATG
jgi:hypothetical protein